MKYLHDPLCYYSKIIHTIYRLFFSVLRLLFHSHLLAFFISHFLFFMWDISQSCSFFFHLFSRYSSPYPYRSLLFIAYFSQRRSILDTTPYYHIKLIIPTSLHLITILDRRYQLWTSKLSTALCGLCWCELSTIPLAGRIRPLPYLLHFRPVFTANFFLFCIRGMQ